MLRKIDTSKLYAKNDNEVVHASKKIFTTFFIIFTFGIMFGLSMIGLTIYIGLEYYNLNLNLITTYEFVCTC